MSKSKYIKVTGKDKKSAVVLAANLGFYKSQDYEISEPKEEEIQAYFPSETATAKTPPLVDTTALESALSQAKADLENEKQLHTESNTALESALSQSKAEINKLQTEIDKLKKKAQ